MVEGSWDGACAGDIECDIVESIMREYRAKLGDRDSAAVWAGGTDKREGSRPRFGCGGRILQNTGLGMDQMLTGWLGLSRLSSLSGKAGDQLREGGRPGDI